MPHAPALIFDPLSDTAV